MSRTKENKRKNQYLQSIVLSADQQSKDNGLIRFNFKYYRFGDGGESFEQWQKDEILGDLNEKLKVFSHKSKVELMQDKTLELYSGYPKGSKFKHPDDIPDEFVEWSRLRIAGKRRLIGFFWKNHNKQNDDVFYVVFLDKNHGFAPSEKKYT